MANKNFYEILGLKKTASEANIKIAYRDLAKKYHPDVNNASDAAKKFKEGHKAYAILSNLYERKLYDDSLISNKIPKDIFAEPKTSTAAAQAAYASPEKTKEEQRKQDTIRKYRKQLIVKAIIKIILNALAGALGGYGIISFLQIFKEGAFAINWFSIFQFGGILSGLILGFIWSIDRYFKIETFIPKQKYRMFFRHFRTATFALATAYIFSFFWRSFTPFSLEHKPVITEIVFGFLFLISVTFASDGEMRNRIKTGKILEILVIFWHNLLIGLCGAFLGTIIGAIFYLVQPGFTIFHISATLGFIFALLIGAVAPKDLELIAQKINQFTRTFIYGILILVAFAVGIGAGFMLSGFIKGF